MASNTDLIIKLRAETKQLRSDLNKAKARMGTFNKNMDKIGASIRNTMLAAFGGAAVLQGIRMAVGSLAEFEFAMDKVAAISGATGDQIGKLKDNALELGRTTKFTASEVSGLQLELSKLGFDPSQIIASTDAVRKLATVTDEELGESAKTMAGTLNSFNLSATESERVANVMAESFSKSALTLEKFTVATANSGAIANALGVTLEQNTARLGALVDANIDASKAGTDLRKIYIDLNKAGISYEDALDMVAKSSDKVATATELVGIRAAGALVILANQREKVDDLTKSLSDNNKELDGMVDIMEDNLITDWKKFTSALDGAIQKAQDGLPALRSLVQIMTDVTNAASDSFDTIQQGADKAVSKLVNKTSDLNKRLELINKTYTKQTEKIRNIAKEKNALASAYGSENQLALVNNKRYAQLTKNYDINLAIIKSLRSERRETIKALDEEGKSVDKVVEATKRLNAVKIDSLSASQLDNSKSGVTESGLPFDTTTQTLQAQEMMAGIKEAIRKSKEDISFEYADLISIMESFNDRITNIMMSTATNMIAGFANAIGSGSGIENAFKVVVGVMADGIQQMGKSLIAYGVLMVAAQAALKNPFSNIGGVGAIIAGGVAVAAGAALKSAISSSSNSISSGGSSNTGSRGGRGTGTFSQERSGKTIRVEGIIKGRDLALVLANENQNKARNGG